MLKHQQTSFRELTVIAAPTAGLINSQDFLRVAVPTTGFLEPADLINPNDFLRVALPAADFLESTAGFLESATGFIKSATGSLIAYLTVQASRVVAVSQRSWRKGFFIFFFCKADSCKHHLHDCSNASQSGQLISTIGLSTQRLRPLRYSYAMNFVFGSTR
ncbi:hypothetical protein MBLNU13_g01811t1 [Cladosporium sp. NU13]